MNIRVYTTRDAVAWRDAVARQPLADVYHLPAYHAAAEANGDGEAFCFVAEERCDVFVHPVLLRPIEDGLTDIESVYGYSGPLSTTLEPGFLRECWDAFASWCSDQGVVAEFVRFNPLSANEGVGRVHYDVSVARQSVVVPLGPDEDRLWNGYPQVQRNMVRRARREGLVVVELDARRLPEFERLYGETMGRVGAERRYLFSSDYFHTLCEGLAESVLLLGVAAGDELVASAFFLAYGDRMHYHLAGSSATGRRAGANNLLLHEAAVRGCRSGRRVLHLGGGSTYDPRDPLLRFKTSVSRDTRPAYIGKRVHDPRAYQRLCAAWLERHDAQERPPFFLLWRFDG